MRHLKSLLNKFLSSKKASISTMVAIFIPALLGITFVGSGLSSDYNNHQKIENNLIFLCNSLINYYNEVGVETSLNVFKRLEYKKDYNLIHKLRDNTDINNVSYNVYKEGDSFVVNLKSSYDSFISSLTGSDRAAQKHYNRECVINQQTEKEILFFTNFDDRPPSCATQKNQVFLLRKTSTKYYNCKPKDWHISGAINLIYETYGRAMSGHHYVELENTAYPRKSTYIYRSVHLKKNRVYYIRFYYKGRVQHGYSNKISFIVKSRRFYRNMGSAEGSGRNAAWGIIQLPFTLPRADKYTLLLKPTGGIDGKGGLIDSVELFTLGKKIVANDFTIRNAVESTSGGSNTVSNGKAPAASGGIAVSNGKAPIRGRAPFVSTNSNGKGPAASGGIAVSNDKAPAASGSNTVSNGRGPAASGGIAVSNDKAPAASSSNTVSNGKAPAASGGIAVSNGKAPAASGGIAVSNGKAPAASGGIAVSNGKAPAASGSNTVSNGRGPIRGRAPFVSTKK